MCFAAGVVVIAKTMAQGVCVVGGCRWGNVRYSLELFTSGAVKVLCGACRGDLVRHWRGEGGGGLGPPVFPGKRGLGLRYFL